MIVVGGYEPGYGSRLAYDDAWAFDLATSGRTQLNPANGPNPEWWEQSAVLDPARHGVVVLQDGYLWALELGEHGPRHSGARVADADAVSTPPLESAASVLALYGARPNPIATEGVVEFSLPDGSPAPLELFDIAGRRVWTQDVGRLGAGPHSVRLSDPRTMAPGVYLLRLTHGEATRETKLVRLPR